MLYNFAIENDKNDAYYYWKAELDLNSRGFVKSYNIVGKVTVSNFDETIGDCEVELEDLPRDIQNEIHKLTERYGW